MEYRILVTRTESSTKECVVTAESYKEAISKVEEKYANEEWGRGNAEYEYELVEAKRQRKTHRLKTVNPYFTDVWEGRKPFELRFDDRDFQVGDYVELFEYDPDYPHQTTNTREIHGEISYVLRDYKGLEPGYCIFAAQETKRYIKAFGPDADPFP